MDDVRAESALEAEEVDTARREVLRAQRSALLGLRRDGVISEEVFEKLSAEVDSMLSGAELFADAKGGPPTQFVEVTLAPESHAADKTVAELSLPRAAVLVSVRRGRDLIIPRGDTRLQAGDGVTVLCENAHVEEVTNLLRATAASSGNGGA